MLPCWITATGTCTTCSSTRPTTAFTNLSKTHPADPLGPASDAAAYLFSEFDRLHILQSEFFIQDQHFYTDNKLAPDPELKRRFEQDLAAARRLAGAAPADANAQFALLLASGLESDYLALIEKRYGASFQEMKAGRAMAEQLLAAHPEYYDAWIAVGVENYMLSVKPAPIRWLLRLAGGETDRASGIEKLSITAAKGHYLAPFARLLLAVAALRDGNRKEAHDTLAGLARSIRTIPCTRRNWPGCNRPGVSPGNAILIFDGRLRHRRRSGWSGCRALPRGGADSP